MFQKYFILEKKPDAKRHYVIPFIKKKKKSKNKGNEFMIIKIRNWLLGMVGGGFIRKKHKKIFWNWMMEIFYPLS